MVIRIPPFSPCKHLSFNMLQLNFGSASLEATRSNHCKSMVSFPLWVADITYVRLQEEFAYLAVVLDAHSRRVIGWALSRNMNSGLTVEALEKAI
jgi:transposase InsO family protein